MRPVLFALVLVVLGRPGVRAQETGFPERPGQREFLRDEVELFTPEQAAQLRQRCDRLLTDTAVPIVVVTLPSVEQYAGKEVTIEQYARQLFDHWGVGSKEQNRGVLVLYVKDTGKVRVELGGGWGHGRDAAVKQILVERLVPKRDAGDAAGGLLAAVEGLEHMVRSPAVTSPPNVSGLGWPVLLGIMLCGGVLLGLFLFLMWHLIGAWRHGGSHGGDAGHWGHTDAGHHGPSGGDVGGGGFGGGSFDGGSSGGGGASV